MGRRGSYVEARYVDGYLCDFRDGTGGSQTTDFDFAAASVPGFFASAILARGFDGAGLDTGAFFFGESEREDGFLAMIDDSTDSRGNVVTSQDHPLSAVSGRAESARS